jgi:hypothetical protein
MENKITFIAKFNFEEEVFFVRLHNTTFDSEFTRIKSGKIKKVIFSQSGIKYEISSGDTYFRDISEEVMFRTKEECTDFLVREIIKERNGE